MPEPDLFASLDPLLQARRHDPRDAGNLQALLRSAVQEFSLLISSAACGPSRVRP